MATVAASLPVPVLTLIDGGRAADAPVGRDLVDLENAWCEVQAVAHDAEQFVDMAIDVLRRIQVAIAIERYGIAGQYAHDLEQMASPYARRARRSELEAQGQLERLRPEPVA